MKQKDFEVFLDGFINLVRGVLGSKSADYSDKGDKTYNFKLAGRIDGVSAIEALRGMQLKHRASVCQGLDELKNGDIHRPYEWWQEKIIDDINYSILLLAMLKFGETNV